MNEKNYDYLRNQVKFMGFGEGLDKQLSESVQGQQATFKLEHQTKFGQDEVSSTLHFGRSKESELYFFNRFDMSVKQAGTEELLKQTYFVGRENNLTLKERYNMIDGRAVFKEFNKLEQVGEGEHLKFKATDETYKAWTQLNFRQTDENGNFLQRKIFGFDLENTLGKYPIKELEDEYDKSRLIASLEKGNRQMATITSDGRDQKVSIEANPSRKTINFYDSNMQRLEVKLTQVQTQKREQKEELARGETNTIKMENKKETLKHATGEESQPAKAERKRQQMKLSGPQ
jgi:hypothetical protein